MGHKLFYEKATARKVQLEVLYHTPAKIAMFTGRGRAKSGMLNE